ncbi:MAG: hypothetical protein E6471_20740, partial [Bradyrhizobium sp.]|nr:hypothetical protein [Bradyrhizobium sp.]
ERVQAFIVGDSPRTLPDVHIAALLAARTAGRASNSRRLSPRKRVRASLGKAMEKHLETTLRLEPKVGFKSLI